MSKTKLESAGVIDFDTIIREKIKTMNQDGSIRKLIEENTGKIIRQSIASQFESFGSIKQAVEDCVKHGLKIDPNNIDFNSYNKQMLVIIRQRLSTMFHDKATKKFIDEMDKILATPPETLSIRHFIEYIVKLWRKDRFRNFDDIDEYATVLVEQSEYGKDSYTLKIWKQYEKTYLHTSTSRVNDPDVEVYIIKGKIRLSHNMRYNPTSFSEVDAYIFKLYAAGTELTDIRPTNYNRWEDRLNLSLKEKEY